MASNPDPLSIATEKTILPPSFGKENQYISEKRDSSSEEAVVVNGGEDIIKESDYTEADYKKLLKKIDRFLLPLMWFCYGVQQTDKTSLGTQAIFGMRTDTNLVGQQYSWLTTIFYLAYLIGEFPSNFLLQRWSLGKSLSIYMLFWGVCVFCVGAAQEWSHLMAIRALQGFFECTISPGFVLVVGSWYRTDEHSSRALFWQSANAGFGILASLVSDHTHTRYCVLRLEFAMISFVGICTWPIMRSVDS
jgi:ACS family allantoate permease-like MFS transporter